MNQLAAASSAPALEAEPAGVAPPTRRLSQHVGRWRQRRDLVRAEARAAATLAASATDESR